MHDKLGQFVSLEVTGEYGQTRYLKAIYERGYITYEVDLVKDRCSNYKHYYEEKDND